MTVYLDASGQYQLTAAELNDGSTDACGVDTMYLDRTQFGCADVGNHTVTLTVEDVHASTCTSTVAVHFARDVHSGQHRCCGVDTAQIPMGNHTVLTAVQAPLRAGRDVTVYLDASGQYQLTAAELDDGSNDACGVDTAYLDRTHSPVPTWATTPLP